MNSRLRKELSLFTIAATYLAARHRYYRFATALAAASLLLRYFPKLNVFSYRHRHVVITGGSRGLGFALAEELLHQEARVTLLARDREELGSALRRLQTIPGAQVSAYVCDVTQVRDVRHALTTAHEHFGPIEVMINNAGAIMAGPFEAMEPTDFQAQVDLHLHAVVEITRILTPYFKVQGGGRFINICSIGGKIPMPHMSPYTASKFALSGFSRTVANELKEYGIRVTTVYPGLMRTGSPIQAVFKGDQPREYGWFAAADLLPGLSMDAKRAARLILQAGQRGDDELVLTTVAKIGNLFYQLFPELTGTLLGVVARVLPHGYSLERRTGAQVQGWFNRLPGTGFLQRRALQAQERFNQQPKTDAEFNLGVQPTRI